MPSPETCAAIWLAVSPFAMLYALECWWRGLEMLIPLPDHTAHGPLAQGTRHPFPGLSSPLEAIPRAARAMLQSCAIRRAVPSAPLDTARARFYNDFNNIRNR